MANLKLSSSQAEAYERDGYVIVKNFVSSEEIHKLQEVAFSDGTMRKHSFDLNDQSGKKTKLTLWYSPGN
ncbi:MAG: phytanoyl-CoA dioxygenase family protein, partial [Ginsengibacter sp.]